LATLGSRESPNEFVKVLKRGLSVCPADYEALVKLEWAVGHLLQETLVDNPTIVDEDMPLRKRPLKSLPATLTRDFH